MTGDGAHGVGHGPQGRGSAFRPVGAGSTIAVIGLGYIGLPAACALACEGVDVCGVDIDRAVVDGVNDGTLEIDEPGLAAALRAARGSGHLHASPRPHEADAFVLAVPTPLTGTDPDLSHIRAAVEAFAPHLRAGNLVALESTVPPGTTEVVGRWLAQLRPDLRFPGSAADADADGFVPHDVCIAHCPERVLPGRVMEEIVANHRVVGGLTPHCAGRAAGLYRTFVHGSVDETDAVTAETAKLVENAFRDVNIAFANEIANVCAELGLDPWQVIGYANRHPRVQILNPGPGVGGHCIAVDPWFLVSAVHRDVPLIRVAREVNDARREIVAADVERLCTQLPAGAPVAVLGLTFKADVDDLRESPALAIVERLTRTVPDRDLLVVDPHLHVLPTSLAGTRAQLTDLAPAVRRSAAVVLLVEHEAFRCMDVDALAGKQVIDTRNTWPSLRGREAASAQRSQLGETVTGSAELE